MASPDLSTVSSTPLFDRLIPVAIREGPFEELRLARILVLVAAFGSGIGVVSGIVHYQIGDHARAFVTFFAGIPFAGSIGLLFATGRVRPSAHLLCASFTAVILLSTALADRGSPIAVAIIALPVAASLVGGWRVGAWWTIAAVGLLLTSELRQPLTEAERSLAMLAATMAGGTGAAVVLVERSRARAAERALEARERAERDERNRRRAEQALQESQALFATAFRRAPSMLVLARLDDARILSVNESFTRLSGWSAREAVGRKLEELDAFTHPDDRERLLRRVLERGTTESVEIRMRKKSGEFVWLLASAEILHLEGRNCLLAQAIDITDRKQRDEVLEHHRARLEARYAERGERLRESLDRLREGERLAAIGTLAAGVAHQINNPIGAIVAATEFALMKEQQGDPDGERLRREALETARAEAKRCGRIVKNVLKFARDEPTAKWVEDVTATVRRACELARPYVEKRGGSLTIDLTPRSLPVLGSPIDLEQALLNLIHNAAESRRDGARVEVRTVLRDTQAEVTVTDDGEGIDRHERSRIFDPFYTSRIEEGGSGLGLSVVHGIVGDHGGELEVEDADGGGTRMRLLLPLADPDQPTDAELDQGATV